ncbi:MAG: ATP-binding protein [Telluria sp.]
MSPAPYDRDHPRFNFLMGGGAMGALIRHHDWSESELGPPGCWPGALRTTLRLILTSNFPMVIFWGPNYLQFYNDAFARLAGTERHPAGLGRSAREFWFETWPDIAHDLDHVMAGRGATWHGDTPMAIVQDGRRVESWWTYGYSPIEDDSGVRGVLAVCSDVTAVHTRKASLRQSYNALVESMDQGFCVVEVLYGEDGAACDLRYVETNPAFEKQSGMRDVIGRRLSELLDEFEPWWLERIGGVDRDGMPARFEAHAAGLGRHFDLYAFRVGPPELHKVGLLFRDVTAQLTWQHALQDEHARLSAVLQVAPVGILVANAQGGLVEMNQEFRRIWGESLPHSTTMGEYVQWHGWWADKPERRGQPVAADEWPMARVLQGEPTSQAIIEIETFDVPPRRRTVAASAAQIRDAHGALTGGVVALMDISDRVRAENALREADRRKDEFLAMLAHELRNPLAPVAAAADLLALGLSDLERTRQTSAIISRQVRHMTGLIDDLLDVSRVTRGLVVLEKTPVDAKRILAHAVEQVRPLIEARGHRLAVHSPPGSAYVCGDHKRLVQVVTNLLTNAAKYTPNGGAIVLRLDIEDSRVIIQVEDTGIGMTHNLLDHAFELFTQAERNADRSQGGLGIGLALVRSLVELHGGSVQAASAGPGLGSTFTVVLPRYELVPEPAVPAQHGQRAPGRAAGKNVLIVDDNVDAAEMLGAFVTALGHHVRMAHDGAGALALAREAPADLCLLDIGLPDMDGYELARRLRAEPATASSTLVAVTGYGQEKDRRAATEAGFDHYLVKPVSNDKLAELLTYGHYREQTGRQGRAAVLPRG